MISMVKIQNSKWGIEFAKKFEGPFQITAMYDNGVEVKNISKPRSKKIRVALNRVRKCPKEIKDFAGDTGYM